MTNLPNLTPDERAALGLDGTKIIEKFGRNMDIDSTEEDILSLGGTWTPFTVSAQTLMVSSNNATDTAAGAGARTVSVNGLDPSGLEISETFSMNGVAAVTGVRQFSVVNRVKVLSTGSAGYNNGDIAVVGSSETAVSACQVEQYFNQSTHAVYRVPSNKIAIILRWGGTLIDPGTATNVNMYLYTKDNSTSSGFNVKDQIHLVEAGTTNYYKDVLIPAGPGSIIKLAADSTAVNTAVFGSFTIKLVPFRRAGTSQEVVEALVPAA